MKSVLMCRPSFFQVSYDINPWMTEHLGNVNTQAALDQWSALVYAISKVAIVRFVEPHPITPDIVFTANAGFVHGGTAIVSNFAKQQRKEEEAIFERWFQDTGFQTIRSPVPYEGEGDHLVDYRGRHWVGSGFRSDPAIKPFLESVVGAPVNVVELVDPRWYHLDTCFCPLPDGSAIWYPHAFSAASQEMILRSFPFESCIPVSFDSALRFICNCVIIGKHLFLPQGTSPTKWVLQKRGYIVHEFALDEFIKAGGAAKCLVLNL